MCCVDSGVERAGVAQQYSFRHYGAAEGLQNLAILSLAQDGAGYIWAGSEGGLYRYDGTRFRLMAAAEGLPCATEVHALHVAADGALWANTCAQIFRFDGQRFQLHRRAQRHVVRRARRWPNDAHGNVVVATPTGLYEAVADGAGSFSARPYPLGPELAGTPMRGIARNGSQLWFGCGRRLCVEDRGRVSIFGPAEGLPEDAWDAIGITPDGSVWVRSPSRLYRKPPGAARLVQEKPDIASSIFWGALTVGRDGSVMVPTDKGLAIRREGDWSGHRRAAGAAHRDDQRCAGRSRRIAVDRADRGRRGALAGLRRMGGLDQGARPAVRPDLEHPARQERRALGGDLPGPGAAGRAGAAADLDQERRLGGRQRALAGRDFRRCHVGGREAGQAWLASIRRPAKIRLFGAADGLPCGTSHRGFVDHLDRLWVATACGVFRNDRPSASDRFHRIDQPASLEHGAWAFAEDKQGTMWITNPDGLWRFSDGRWRQYRKADGLLSDNPYIATIGPDGALWLHHRFDAGIERVEFSGDRIVRSTAVLPADASSVEVTAFHGFDACGPPLARQR